MEFLNDFMKSKSRANFYVGFNILMSLNTIIRVCVQMKTYCKKYSDSISPKTMPKSNKEIKKLLECLKEDVELYVSSLEVGEDDFVNHFRNSIMPILEKKGLFKSFETQLTKYIRVLDAKTVSIFHSFQVSMKKLFDDLEHHNRIQKYQGTDSSRFKHVLVEAFKLVYVDFTNLLMIASQIFFALEFYCKILCALGCVRFALKVAREELIQHNVCWKQLKSFSEKSSHYCETCIVSDTCKSKIDFEALSRIYCYCIKIRQIADYTPKLVSLNIRKSGLIEPPISYFYNVEFLLKQNSLFYSCLADIIPDVGYGRKELVEELRSPFIWENEKGLKEALKKNKDSDFYNYLLGTFYYHNNRFDEAIEPLERARKINPKNADVWNLLAIIYDAQAETKKDLEKALEYFRRARDLAPSDHDILWKVGILELSFDRYSSAIENLAKACDHATTDFDKFLAFLTLSEAYRMKGMIDESELYLRKSQQIRKDTDTSLKWLRKYIEERKKAKSI